MVGSQGEKTQISMLIKDIFLFFSYFRRLGGGLSGYKESGQLRFGGRYKKFGKAYKLPDHLIEIKKNILINEKVEMKKKKSNNKKKSRSRSKSRSHKKHKKHKS